MTRGIVYYNAGEKCLLRLLVSIYTLRKVYSGAITIFHEGDNRFAERTCADIAKIFNADYKKINLEIPESANRVYLAKPKIYEVVPYDVFIWIDADTIILKNFDELFDLAEKHQLIVAQFSNWLSAGGQIKRRIMSWEKYYPDLVKAAIKFGPAINCGVVGMRKDATVLKDWYKLAVVGSDLFIPDETCLQLILHKYQHHILSQIYNCSCKYDKLTPPVKIIHFHGRKHCRKNLPFMGNVWIQYFNEVKEKKIYKLDRLIKADRTLRIYLRDAH